ncbi:MAG: GGDEF domain-containing protein [Pseudodesulfovibrio sp.]|uniref:diguanylate cyclase n=1 Tax=Pseudodesulfovibrio aespoeensis (strain ATCC 700646 / DSM 10631 / Aspo-2) TaxID=643562 RepID=E6VWG4_PSEA9|nr:MULTISPECIES: GGDEF domain-containing protein [Pseudodesulfovibrio]MBU4193072.1 GGDEF domain-containing protein [Pseudomonadota bacterium]ADU61370.1 diguanylate cyclase [Pseudodesulfovibrio aespoeensis Aspo-2]MBU4242982.1 GGDEF domain-containing protein [Pseudomonadota bacterium]MBU4378527.1 GGDEF domain-containing protein [Pseudomonadota bacterium]MBU4474763.1 GGDEF domain-containing protein [Pseudomonadota bacterium]
MAQDTPPADRLKTRYKLFYTLSVAALAALLCTNFGVIYTLIILPPEDPELMMKFVYIVMVAGFFVLAAQALLVYTRVLSLLGREAKAMSQLREQVDKLSVYDDLTKVYNRYKFESVAERELDNVRRYANPLSGIMFDIDDFKGINETHGYKTGDMLLANLAQFVSARLRKTDYVFRWRGGKFIILAPHTDIDKAAMVAEKLRQIVGHKLFGGKIRMALSLGVVQGRADDTMETFLHRVQSALTGAKNQGRNRVVVSRG